MGCSFQVTLVVLSRVALLVLSRVALLVLSRVALLALSRVALLALSKFMAGVWMASIAAAMTAEVSFCIFVGSVFFFDYYNLL